MKELKYEIEQDELDNDPREWDNLGTMHCWHSKYKLGDVQHKSETEDEFFMELGNFMGDSYWTDKEYDLHKKAAIKRAEQEYIILPLYLYDHSGLSISTGGFNDQWDSGQVGFIVVSIADVKKEYSWKVLTKARREQIEAYLRTEVEEYDQYLRGDIWWFAIKDEDDAIIDSCGGFYGYDYCEEEAKIALSDAIDSVLAKEAEERSKNISQPHYKYSPSGDKLLDAYVRDQWPYQYQELKELIRDHTVNNEIENEYKARYFELRSFIRDSMMGSISRYYSPARED